MVSKFKKLFSRVPTNQPTKGNHKFAFVHLGHRRTGGGGGGFNFNRPDENWIERAREKEEKGKQKENREEKRKDESKENSKESIKDNRKDTKHVN